MCEIMTTTAAAAFTAIYAVQKKRGKSSKPVLFAVLMFWSAALMWAVDGIASVAGGEGFFYISLEDATLGLIIIASGLLLFGISALIHKRKAVPAA